MTIVLQNRNDQEFIETTQGAWTPHSKKAHIFATGIEALFFCFNHNLRNMQIVGIFADSKMNFSFPIADAYGPTQ